MNVIPIVLGAYYNAYSVIRAFGEQGIKSILITKGEKNFISKSKYLKMSRCLKDVIFDERGFVDDLLTLGQQLAPDKGMFFPTHDEELIAIAKYKDELSRYFEIPFSNFETLSQIMDKDFFSDVCKKIGIPTIRDFKVKSYQDGIMALEEFKTPILVKVNQYSIKTIEAFGKKIAIFCNESDYLDAMKSFFELYPSGELLVQEYIQDSSRLMPNVNSYTDKEGNLQCVFVSEKVRQYPPQRGTSTATWAMNPEEQCYKEIIDSSKRICKYFKFYGLFGIEFKYDPKDGKYKVIEMNCRAEFPNYLQTVVGQNMAYAIYRYHLGLTPNIPYYPVIKSASCYVPVLDRWYATKTNKYNYPSFLISRKEWKKSIIKPITLYGVTKKDILPFLSAYLFEIRNAMLVLVREKARIPENMSTKDYLKNKLRFIFKK